MAQTTKRGYESIPEVPVIPKFATAEMVLLVTEEEG